MFHLLVLNLSFKYMFVFLLACKVRSRSLLWENWPACKRALFLYTFKKSLTLDIVFSIKLLLLIQIKSVLAPSVTCITHVCRYVFKMVFMCLGYSPLINACFNQF